MVDTNWVDWPGTKHPTCSCGLVNALANFVVVNVQHNAALAIVTGGVQGEATTSNAHLLVTVCSFIVGFVSFVVIIPFHAVVVNFINDREPDATVRPCTRVLGLLLDYLFTTSHGAACEFPCPFAPCLSPFPLSRVLGVGDPCCWGEGEGVRRHIHLLCMLQRVDIPSQSYPFVLTSFVLVIFIQIR
jgi:hypothetical protein